MVRKALDERHRAAVSRLFPFNGASRLFWLKTAVILAFCIGLAMSSRLWIGPRSYPPAPVFGTLPVVEGVMAYGLFAALFVFAAAALISPKPQKFIAAFLAIIAVLCLFDQTRWQPSGLSVQLSAGGRWRYSRWSSGDIVGQQRTLNIARLIIASTYIFSGLQKMNLNFIFENDFPWLVQPITNVFPSSADLFHYFGMAVPFVQVAFGIGLLTKRYRRVSLLVAVSMHLFILAMFGPAGLDWSNVIWPWMTAMALFDISLRRQRRNSHSVR